jgi:hypothetical protein
MASRSNRDEPNGLEGSTPSLSAFTCPWPSGKGSSLPSWRGGFDSHRALLQDSRIGDRLRYYSNFDLLVIDEFGFDKIERAESGQAASLLYKVVDSRGPNRSTALVTNIGFEAWADYLGDAPLAMAILDRLVDGAIVLKIEGRSYRAHRSKQSARPARAEIPKSKGRRESTG